MTQIKIGSADLSITCTGFARTDGTTGLIKTKTGDGDRRLVIIRNALLAEISDADVVVIEDAPTGLKGNAAKAILHLQGAVRAELLSRGIPYVEIAPSTLKKYATGNGSATKSDMAMAAYKRAGVEFEKDRTGDQADAWWLRCAGLDRYSADGGLSFVLPADQRAALGKAQWPEPVRYCPVCVGFSPVLHRNCVLR
jgi:Holliday junction resolvasome RuvABC endonuclease subunit